MLPRILPWLALLVLLALKPNRCASAWFVAVPLAFGLGVSCVFAGLLGQVIPSEPMAGMCQSMESFVYALAAVWLISFWFGRKHLFLVFLGITVTMALAALARVILMAGFEEDWTAVMMTGMLVGCGAVAVAATLVVAGWRARREYRPMRLIVWTVVLLPVAWLAIAAPFALFAVIASGGDVPIGQLLLSIGSVAGLSFALLLPFLLLSFLSPFYRERLKALLHLDQEELPPILPPVAQPAISA